MSQIEVRDHDPTWAASFEGVAAELRRALDARGATYLAIEHVGSTSVPGLAAKPVLDVDVVVPRDAVAPPIAALVGAGDADLGTMGIDDRWALGAPDPPRRNVDVVVAGSLALRNHLGVRDVLRRDPELRARYGALKRELGRRFGPDEIDRYVEGKSTVLADVLAAAGLAPDELASIESDSRAQA